MGGKRMSNCRRLFGAVGLTLVVTLGTMGVGSVAGAQVASTAEHTTASPVKQLHRGLTGEPVVAVRRGVTTSCAPNQVCADVSVGAGWYLYLYLNRGNVNWLRGLGYAAASSALCAWVATTVIGGIICGVAAYAIWTVIQRYAHQVPTGYCVEAKFTYGGRLAGSKLVHRNC